MLCIVHCFFSFFFIPIFILENVSDVGCLIFMLFLFILIFQGVNLSKNKPNISNSSTHGTVIFMYKMGGLLAQGKCLFKLKGLIMFFDKPCSQRLVG